MKKEEKDKPVKKEKADDIDVLISALSDIIIDSFLLAQKEKKRLNCAKVNISSTNL